MNLVGNLDWQNFPLLTDEGENSSHKAPGRIVLELEIFHYLHIFTPSRINTWLASALLKSRELNGHKGVGKRGGESWGLAK